MRKSGTRPTKKQSIFIRGRMRLNPDNWLVVKDTPEEFVIKNRITGKLRIARKVTVNV
jgi:hypothetical protein